MFDFIRANPKKRSIKIRNKSGVIFTNVYGIKKILFDLGTISLSVSFCFLVYLYQPLVSSWIKYKNIEKTDDIVIQNNRKPTISKSLFSTPTPTPTPLIYKEEVIVEENKDFFIDIPKIGAKSKIIADVSPADKKNYLKVLENNNIAHSNMSALPGNGKGSTTYLFAHSTEQSVKTVRKNSVFYLLGELSENDKIFINYRGQNIEYKVYMKKVISAKESEYLTYSEADREVLILQTCWPIGTNWKRLLVFAQRI